MLRKILTYSDINLEIPWKNPQHWELIILLKIWNFRWVWICSIKDNRITKISHLSLILSPDIFKATFIGWRDEWKSLCSMSIEEICDCDVRTTKPQSQIWCNWRTLMIGNDFSLLMLQIIINSYDNGTVKFLILLWFGCTD